MREIKFRAWDKAQGKWCKWEDQTSPAIDLYHCFRYNSLMVDNDQYDFPPEIILMQYTGLKDKNGKEIYEGDILKVPMNRGRDQMFEIKWSNKDWGWRGFWKREYTSQVENFGHLTSFIEVIGNIYENRDLLNDKEAE